jgi:hypothetical protein
VRRANAAAVLAEALVGDLTEAGGDSRWAAMALAQLIGPWREVHGWFPGVAELRDLLDREIVRADLRAALDERARLPTCGSRTRSSSAQRPPSGAL